MSSSGDTKNENPGVVTSDSLAAESIREGGSFAANSDARGPMDQPSYSTNTANTDISGATTLQSAPDAAARQAEDEWSESAALNAGSNLGRGAGVRDATNQAAAAPPQPKGKNLTEGGFDSGAPNASFNADIGGKNDPGRAALERMEASDVPSAGGAGPRQTEITGDGQYDTLGETNA